MRFALDSGSGLRAGRWLARAVVLGAAWPLWYGLFAEPNLDWEALMVGIAGELIGLTLWAWTGYRLRNPSAFVEIDLDAGVARLCRGQDTEPLRCALAELGEWSITSWRSTGGKSVTTWYAARCPGFGDQNLFVELDPAGCRSWCTRVDAVARPSVLDAVTLAAVTHELSHTSLADRLGHGFDGLIDRGRGPIATIGLVAITGLVGLATVRQILETDGRNLEANVALALIIGLVTLGWQVVRGPVIAAVVAGTIGAAMASKPWLAPVVRVYDGTAHTLSPTSETHLYSVLPGLALLVLALGLLSTIQVRKPHAIGSTRTRADKVDLPPPEPPKPPGASPGDRG